jgi:hypothetical protein
MDSDSDFKESEISKKKKKADDSDEENVHKFPEVTEDAPAKFTMSKRGKPMLIDPFNYLYQKNRDYKGQTFWRCSREQSTVLPR